MSTVVAGEVRSQTLQDTPNVALGSAGDIRLNCGFGSMSDVAGCRAWAQFGLATTVPVLRQSGNVSSLTDQGVGDVNVTFENPMPDPHFCAQVTTGRCQANYQIFGNVANQPNLANSVRVQTMYGNINTAYDVEDVHVVVFR